MKILNLVTSILAVLCIIFIFFNWKISIVLFLIATIFQVIPYGPNKLLNVLTGYFMIGGIVYLFINWKIGIALIIGSFLIAKFHVWGNKVNYDYYNKKNKDSDTTKKEKNLSDGEFSE